MTDNSENIHKNERLTGARRWRRKMSFFRHFALFLLVCPPLMAADWWQEGQINDILRQTAEPTEVVTFDQITPQASLGLFENSRRNQTHGAVIILGELHTHADWPQVTAPLRRSLPDHGWATLALQLPYPLDRSDEQLEHFYTEAEPRLQAAIAWLADRGLRNVVLIGHGHGAALAARFQAQQQDARVQAMVLIGTGLYDEGDNWRNPLKSLERLPLPMLDLYAEYDLPEVLDSVAARREAARRAATLAKNDIRLQKSRKVQELAKNVTGNLRYRQTMISATDHFFSTKGLYLVTRVKSWLKNYAPGEKSKVK